MLISFQIISFFISPITYYKLNKCLRFAGINRTCYVYKNFDAIPTFQLKVAWHKI